MKLTNDELAVIYLRLPPQEADALITHLRTVDAELLDLRSKIEAARASVKRIKRACEAVYKNIDCLNVEVAANCAHSGEAMCDELEAALSKQGEGR